MRPNIKAFTLFAQICKAACMLYAAVKSHIAMRRVQLEIESTGAHFKRFFSNYLTTTTTTKKVLFLVLPN